MVAQMKRYSAVVERDGRYWMVTVPEIDRVTQARNLNEVDEMARDLIALIEDIPSDSFEITQEIRLPASIANHVERSRALREQELRVRAEAAAEIREAAREMAALRMTLHDIGKSLGVSYQRASQLVNS